MALLDMNEMKNGFAGKEPEPITPPIMPDTQDKLFELCKEVYERTKWRGTDYVIEEQSTKDGYYTTEAYKKSEQYVAPLYTSDYLLEKLLSHTNIDLCKQSDGKTLITYNLEPLKDLYIFGITTLIGLLKVVIALHDAGELNPKGEIIE